MFERWKGLVVEVCDVGSRRMPATPARAVPERCTMKRMHRFYVASALACSWALCVPVLAEAPPRRAGTPSAVAASDAVKYPCGESSCTGATLLPKPKYSQQIAASGYFSGEFGIEHNCGCTRHLSLLVAFTTAGTNVTKERTFKLDVPPGKSQNSVVISNAELAAAKITPSRYNLTFALYDERERLMGAAQTGNPFMLGSSKEALPAKPHIPDEIAAKDDLAVTFAFTNDGDATARATALLVFTRPGTENSIEHYEPNLIVPPGGAKHVVRVSAALRRKLGVGNGVWLVGASGFDAAGGRMASYPGNPLSIGKVITLAAPEVRSPIQESDDLDLKLTVRNDSEVGTDFSALLIFTRAGDPKSVEYERDGLRAPPGATSHNVVISPGERARVGLVPGRWRIAFSGFDAAGKRVETVRGREIVISAGAKTALR